jgi:hypothetical protein
MTVVMTGVMIVITTVATIGTAATVLGRLFVVITMTAVLPGPRHPAEGMSMIEGLQGTMITGAEDMMTADSLIMILTDVGMIKTAAGTTGGVTTKKNGMMTELGPPMERAIGLVEKFECVVGGRTDGVEWFLCMFNGLLRSLWCCRRLLGPVYFLYWLVNTSQGRMRNDWSLSSLARLPTDRLIWNV